jgi:hypothetical protein
MIDQKNKEFQQKVNDEIERRKKEEELARQQYMQELRASNKEAREELEREKLNAAVEKRLEKNLQAKLRLERATALGMSVAEFKDISRFVEFKTLSMWAAEGKKMVKENATAKYKEPQETIAKNKASEKIKQQGTQNLKSSNPVTRIIKTLENFSSSMIRELRLKATNKENTNTSSNKPT